MNRQQKITLARSKGMNNVSTIFAVAVALDVPDTVALALFLQESSGRNVYGHDAGGMLSGFPGLVTKANYEVFRYMVVEKGYQSNGVGPSQITYRGFFPQMESQGFKPWDVQDNMFFGLRLLNGYHKSANGSWREAGAQYNGSSDYGEKLVAKIKYWKDLFGE